MNFLSLKKVVDIKFFLNFRIFNDANERKLYATTNIRTRTINDYIEQIFSISHASEWRCIYFSWKSSSISLRGCSGPIGIKISHKRMRWIKLVKKPLEKTWNTFLAAKLYQKASKNGRYSAHDIPRPLLYVTLWNVARDSFSTCINIFRFTKWGKYKCSFPRVKQQQRDSLSFPDAKSQPWICT